MRFFTFRRAALAARLVWQSLRFLAGKGYYLVGRRPRPVTMFDSVDVSQIPAGARAVAGYVGGSWPTFPKLERLFPSAFRLSIAVNAGEDAECLDVEQGDATISQAADWVKRQRFLGVKRPVVYTSVSQAGILLRVLERAGIGRGDIRLWTAHYTFAPHLCGPGCGFGFSGRADATQYSDHAFGRDLDASLVAPGFFS